jgi:HNH endonuclease
MEIWMPIPSIPGAKASSLGRILLPEKVRPQPNGGVRKYKSEGTYGVKHKAKSDASHVRMKIFIRGIGNRKIHRLVCEAFHGCAPFANAVVLHIDEDATNNTPSNLRWGTQKENLNFPGFIQKCKDRRLRRAA